MAANPLIEEYRAIAKRARDRYFALFEERERINREMEQAQLDHAHAEQWAQQLEAQTND